MFNRLGSRTSNFLEGRQSLRRRREGEALKLEEERRQSALFR